MTRKLTVLFDDTETDTGKTAYDTINQLRDLSRKLADERRRHGIATERYRKLALQWEDTADDLAVCMLEASLIWSDEDACQEPTIERSATEGVPLA